ncbi:MAG: hypothetical protein QGI51_03260 [Dehalococcoidales bacterium]|nr:hypothetical protein [Dehalococcoidales bacterium]MDP6632506.1 hypothetical protein [Dehalococcoidales bacterium]
MVQKIIAQLWRAIFPENVWQEIQISPYTRPEPTLRCFTYLRGRGVRCYMHNLTSPNPRGVSSGTMGLRVHRDDLQKANLLLREMKE